MAKFRTREESRAVRAFREVRDKAGMNGVLHPNDMWIRGCLNRGEPLPDDLLPGRFLAAPRPRGPRGHQGPEGRPDPRQAWPLTVSRP